MLKIIKIYVLLSGPWSIFTIPSLHIRFIDCSLRWDVMAAIMLRCGSTCKSRVRQIDQPKDESTALPDGRSNCQMACKRLNRWVNWIFCVIDLEKSACVSSLIADWMRSFQFDTRNNRYPQKNSNWCHLQSWFSAPNVKICKQFQMTRIFSLCNGEINYQFSIIPPLRVGTYFSKLVSREFENVCCWRWENSNLLKLLFSHLR